MIVQIWRTLAQILLYRIDLIETIKPFFENLKNETINNEKYIPLLKTFSKNQLEVLYQYGIIDERSTKETNFTVNNKLSNKRLNV